MSDVQLGAVLATIPGGADADAELMILSPDQRAALRCEPRGHSAHVFAHGSSHRHVCANRGPFPEWLGARAVILEAERGSHDGEVTIALDAQPRGAGRSQLGSTRPPTSAIDGSVNISRIVGIQSSATRTSSSVKARIDPCAPPMPALSAGPLPFLASCMARRRTGNRCAAWAMTCGVASVLPLSTTMTSSPGS